MGAWAHHLAGMRVKGEDDGLLPDGAGTLDCATDDLPMT
jgi:hypothetical protein